MALAIVFMAPIATLSLFPFLLPCAVCIDCCFFGLLSPDCSIASLLVPIPRLPPLDKLFSILCSSPVAGSGRCSSHVTRSFLISAQLQPTSLFAVALVRQDALQGQDLCASHLCISPNTEVACHITQVLSHFVCLYIVKRMSIVTSLLRKRCVMEVYTHILLYFCVFENNP